MSTVHGSDIFGLNGRILGAFKRSALRASDVVTANSNATKAAIQLLAPEISPRVIPMGVHLSRSAGPEMIHRWKQSAGGMPLVVFVGRLVEWKGAQDLLDALSLAKAHASSYALSLRVTVR